ncbi:phytoene desaturase family protein [Nocardioides sp.]|uniref:phytoene desaturase family protein n=1 Tax=Nocardioides sp. TaxID=35761 RepID=UPI003567334D
MTPPQTYDAVVVGAGPNGLVAANHLVDAGWSVLLLESQPEVGGAVRSDRDVHPDFVHDTFSAFYPLAVASSAVTSLRLEEHGLAWSHAPAVLGHPRSDGSWALQHRDREVTASLMDADHAGDGAAWLELCAQWDRVGDQLVEGLVSPFPPVRAGLGLLGRLPAAGGLGFVKTLLTPAAQLGRSRFGGDAPRLLLAGNAGHADIPLDAPGSGLMALLLTMLGQTVGFPVPVGGAGALTAAMARRFVSLGGEIRTGAEVTGIDVESGRAVGVRLADGTRIGAGNAVVADVTAPALYGGLVAPEHLPARVVRGMRSFELDPSTIKVDWALDGPVPWAQAPAYAPGTFHVADSVEQMTEAFSQIAARAIPADPFLLCGQMTTSDPTRSPEGTESVWAYTHMPQHSVRDAGDGGIRGVWDRDDCERMADRMQARLERLAPGFGSRVLARRVLGPHEMEARNANLVGGSINGGTAQLHQELVFRPVPGLGRPETGIRGLYLGSSSAHPGGGVHGAAGRNAARAALAHTRLGRILPQSRRR